MRPTPPATVSANFDVYGVRIDVTANGEALVAPVRELLGSFECSGDIAADAHVDFRVVDSIDDIEVPSEGSGHVTRWWTYPLDGSKRRIEDYCSVYRRTGGGSVVEFAAGALLEIGPDASWAHAWFVRPGLTPADCRISIAHYAVTEILKWRGIYSIHASAVTRKGHGFLFPGSSGAGKTTACLSLIRGGYQWLGDEHIYLRHQDADLTLMSLPLRFNVTQNTMKAIPELAERAEWNGAGPKQRVNATVVREAAHTSTCRPDFMIFPHIVNGPQSSLSSISKRKAFECLLPETMTVGDRGVAAKQFIALDQLVRHTTCLRLDFGRDILDLPALIDGLIES